jgi:hypothetical protein
MTIRELMSILQRLPFDAEVILDNWDSYLSYNASTVLTKVTYYQDTNTVVFEEEG